VGEGVDQDAVEWISFGGGLAQGGDEQSAGFKGDVGGVGQIEEGEWGAGLRAEPGFEKRSDGRGGGGPEIDGDVVFRESPGGKVWAGVGGADGDKEARGFETESGEAGVGGGDGSDLLGLIEGAGGFGDGEREGAAVDEGDGGGLAVGEFDGEAEAEARTAETELVRADFVEETRAIAEQDGGADDGVPDDVAKAAQAGEGEADLVPIGVEGERVRRAYGLEAAGGEGDGAGVGDVEREGLAGEERGGEGDGGLVQLAGMVGVGVDGDDVEGDGERLCAGSGEANAFPVERGGDLERNEGQRGVAVVAEGEEGADGDLLIGGEKMDVEIEGVETDGYRRGG